jgi:hypothetical protein
MALKLTILANVVDIRGDDPGSTDAFLVDTNVWFWMTYTRAPLGPNPPRQYQTKHYPSYLSKVRRNNARLFRCGLSMPELAHRIEVTEREIFEKQTNTKLGPKGFRHNQPHKRAIVATELRTAWDQAKSMAEPLDLVIDDAMIEGALTRFNNQLLDGYDLLILETAFKEDLTQILTDDVDFCTVPGITVFTANNTAISNARDQGKLHRR